MYNIYIYIYTYRCTCTVYEAWSKTYFDFQRSSPIINKPLSTWGIRKLAKRQCITPCAYIYTYISFFSGPVRSFINHQHLMAAEVNKETTKLKKETRVGHD